MIPTQTTRLPAIEAAGTAHWPGNDEAVRPVHFGEPAGEYRAARETAAVFDVHDRVQIVATGGDAVSFLNNFCTAKLGDLAAGQGTEAFFPNIKGRVISHAFLFRGEQAVYLSADPGQGERLLGHLRKYHLGEDIELVDSTGAWGELLVAGPEAAPRVQAVTGFDAAALPEYGHGETTLDPALLADDDPLAAPEDAAEAGDDRRRLVVRRVPIVGLPGFLLASETRWLDRLWPQLAAVAEPAGDEVYEALRIEAGWPQVGLDITDSHLVHEVARTDRAVSFEKGCYLGQEPIARLDAMGHTNRELRTLRIEGEQPLEDNDVTLPGEAAGGDSPAETPPVVGQVSSSAAVPGQGERVALAVVKTKAAAIGTSVVVAGRAGVVQPVGGA